MTKHTHRDVHIMLIYSHLLWYVNALTFLLILINSADHKQCSKVLVAFEKEMVGHYFYLKSRYRKTDYFDLVDVPFSS